MNTSEYTPEQQREIQRLLDKYDIDAETPLEKARQLDKVSKQRIFIATFFFSVVAAVLATAGIYCCFIWHVQLLPFGCFIGALGLTLCCMIPHVYKLIKRAERDRLSHTIIELLCR